MVCNLKFPSEFGRIRGRSGPQTVTAFRQPPSLKEKIIYFFSFSLTIGRPAPHKFGIVRHVSVFLSLAIGCEARKLSTNFVLFYDKKWMRLSNPPIYDVIVKSEATPSHPSIDLYLFYTFL